MAQQKKKVFKGERTAATLCIIVGLIGFLFVMWTRYRIVYTAVIAGVAVASCFEVLRAVGAKNKILYGISMAVSAFIPFMFSYHLSLPFSVLLSAYVLLVLFLMVAMNKNTKFVDVLTAFYSSLWLPYCYSCFIFIRDMHLSNPDTYTKWDAYCLLMLVFACSWAPDSLAYLCGKRFGKHKLAPVISPKKSVEGAVGGVVLCGILVVPILFVYNLIISKTLGTPVFASLGYWKYPIVSLMVAVLSVVSIFGDLTCSVIKRNFGIKDYGKSLGSHGGFMDRFDSCLFVLPAYYALLSVINM